MNPATVKPADNRVEHPDVAQRVAHGRATRRVAPRSSHATWVPDNTRPDPVQLLRSQERTRVPELVGLRHERMLASPFAFYRGSAIVMASDLATMPNSGLQVQCCGDAHLANFGGFASPDRTLVFDINDFDETNPGPFEWDVKRLATSFTIAAQARGLSSQLERDLARQTARAYRDAMRQFAAMTNLETWYASLDVDSILLRWQTQLSAKQIRRFEDQVARAHSKDSIKALTKLAERVGDEYRIKSDPPLLVPIDTLVRGQGGEETGDQLREWLRDRFRVYRHSLQPSQRRLLESYRIVDFARKVVGVGSVGTRCWIALLLGKDDTDPLFLQIKEAEHSVLERYTAKSGYASAGQRVVEGQRLLQVASDILLGWVRTPGIDGVERDFYVRQLWDWKVSADLETIPPSFMKVYAKMCGWTLAHGHARSGDRVAIAAYLGSSDVFDHAIADFSVAYAAQNARDFAQAQGTMLGGADRESQQ